MEFVEENYNYATRALLEDEQVVLESILVKLQLSKEDLTDPEKIKQAVSKINAIDDEYERRNSIISFAGSILGFATSICGVLAVTAEGKIISIIMSLFINICKEGAKYTFGVSDYRKLLGYINREIDKIERKKTKIKNRDEEIHDTISLKELEEYESKLENSKDIILAELRKANRKVPKEEK